MRSRYRSIVAAIVACLIFIDVSLSQILDDVEIKVHQVAGQTYYLEGYGGNIGLFIGEDGVFLIDDQFAALTDRVVDAIRTLSDQPIRFLINTHLHPDHTGGNEDFGKIGTLIFGHDNVRRQMALSNYAEEPPLVTFSEDLSFHINGETVHVFKTPDAHTDGDVFVHFTGSNVIHAGDVYRTTTYPYIDTEHGGSFLGTIAAMELLIALADENTRIIPGHGIASDKKEAQLVLSILQVVRDRVQAAVNEGNSLAQSQAAGLTHEYDERWNTETGRGTSAALVAAAYRDLANR